MKYPSIEQYMDALQAPGTSVLDPALSGGRVQLNSWGAPLARSGQFALTFKIAAGGRQYAVRCFQFERPGMHQRYSAISRALAAQPLPYFVDFDYQDAGLRVAGSTYPAIRMDWAEGTALGNYIEEHLRDPGRLRALQQQIHGMALALEGAGLAHGDIQSNNILVGSAGDLRLVDYDGMYVPALSSMGAIETGHRNFQHPERGDANPFDAAIDRFSFALLHTALTALIEDPSLWSTLQADGDTLLFRSSDLQDSDSSEAFKRISGLGAAGPFADRLRAIAKAPYANVPTFGDFLAGRNIPKGDTTLRPRAASPAGGQAPWYAEAAGLAPSISSPSSASAPAGGIAAYMATNPVVDATDPSIASFDGLVVELVGQVRFVRVTGKSHHLYLTPAGSEPTVRLTLTGAATTSAPATGQWVAATGRLGSAASGSKDSSTFGVSITKGTDVSLLTSQQARWRLAAGSNIQPAGSGATQRTSGTSSNSGRLGGLSGTSPAAAGATFASGPPSPSPVPSSIAGKSDRSTLVIVAIIIAATLGVILLGSFLSSSASSSGQSGSSTTEIRVSAKSDAADLTGRCYSSLDPLVQAPCDWSTAFYRAGLTPMVEPNECPAGTPIPLRAGDARFVCLAELSKSPSGVAPGNYETCVEIDSAPEERSCASGLVWVFGSCTSASGNELQAPVGASWEPVKRDITTRDDPLCEADFPFGVDFVREMQPDSEERFRILYPAKDGSDPYYEYVTVTVEQVS